MKERVFKKLPAIHQTDVLDKFFKTTVDQWFGQEDIVRAAGYVGRKSSSTYNPEKDFYFLNSILFVKIINLNRY